MEEKVGVEENQVADSNIGKGTQDVKNSEYASELVHNMLTPGSKKSISQNDKESSQKANFSDNEKDDDKDEYLSV